MLFRADELTNLTDTDLGYLSAIPMVSIVDFRSDSEVATNPDRVAQSVKNLYHLPINPGNLSMATLDSHTATDSSGRAFMKMLNVQLVSNKESIAEYRKFFEILQREGTTPLLFHCTAGKDRTGMAAALFLYSLGVSDADIEANYLESNDLLREKYKVHIETHPALKTLLTVEPDYLGAGIDWIKANYGSVENYLTQVLGVDIDLMKKLYLDD